MKKTTLQNKNCLITGATGSLGTALAMEFGRNNCNLFLTSQSDSKLISLQNTIMKKFDTISVKTFASNLANMSDIDNLINNVRQSYTKIDILINCAGILPIKFIQDSSMDDFDECFNINIRAPIFLTKEFVKDMVHQKWG